MCKNISEKRNTYLHPFGMLDRDQRTTSITKNMFGPNKNKTKYLNSNCVISCDSATENKMEYTYCNKIHRFSCTDNTQSKPNYYPNSIQRHCRNMEAMKPNTLKYVKTKFSDYLLICIFVWILTVHQSFAHPINMQENEYSQLLSKLNNPCNGNSSVQKMRTLDAENIKDMFDGIKRRSSGALIKANEGMQQYMEIKILRHSNSVIDHSHLIELINKTDKQNLNGTEVLIVHTDEVESFHRTWENDTRIQDWMYPRGMKLNKKFRETLNMLKNDFRISSQNLNHSDITKLLTDCDHRLQLVAIGLYHIMKDHKEQNQQTMEKEKYDMLSTIYRGMTDQLGTVLCEVRTTVQKYGLVTFNVEPKNNFPKRRDALGDYIIIREFINQLEYINQVFAHLRDQLIKEIQTTGRSSETQTIKLATNV